MDDASRRICVGVVCAVLLSACGESSLCVRGATQECSLASGQKGLSVCSADGSQWLACDMSQCAPDASQACVSGVIYAVDRCGNRAAQASRACICSCATDGKSCVTNYSDPLASPPASGCTDRKTCLHPTSQCIARSDLFWVETLFQNTCAEAIKCFYHAYRTNQSSVGVGTLSSCIPTNTSLGPNGTFTQRIVGQRTQAACDALVSPDLLESWKCVLATDPASCLPTDCGSGVDVVCPG